MSGCFSIFNCLQLCKIVLALCNQFGCCCSVWCLCQCTLFFLLFFRPIDAINAYSIFHADACLRRWFKCHYNWFIGQCVCFFLIFFLFLFCFPPLRNSICMFTAIPLFDSTKRIMRAACSLLEIACCANVQHTNTVPQVTRHLSTVFDYKFLDNWP